jgi:hypothetical protein
MDGAEQPHKPGKHCQTFSDCHLTELANIMMELLGAKIDL